MYTILIYIYIVCLLAHFCRAVWGTEGPLAGGSQPPRRDFPGGGQRSLVRRRRWYLGSEKKWRNCNQGLVTCWFKKKDPGSEHVCFESVYIYIYRKKSNRLFWKWNPGWSHLKWRCNQQKNILSSPSNIAINGLVNCMLYKATYPLVI